MDPYLWLRFSHLAGLMLMSAGLIGVFIADMRSRQVRDLRLFAQAITFIAVFYDGLVVPGALLLLASGSWLIAGYHGGWDFIGVPWLAGMVILFTFEFIEGNTVTRLYFVRLRRLTRQSLKERRVTPELVRARGERVASFTHFLDIPILLVIVSLGVLRPDTWTQFVVASLIAVAVAVALNSIVPRLYPRGGEEPGRPGPGGTGAELSTSGLRGAPAVNDSTADEVIARLALSPHPEGGHYRETFRHRPANGERGAITVIYYLLRAGERSAWHRIDATEVWHFYAGAPIELLIADASARTAIMLGTDFAAGMAGHGVVPAHAWQSARSLGAWTLVGCTVAPAFEFLGFELAPPELSAELTGRWTPL